MTATVQGAAQGLSRARPLAREIPTGRSPAWWGLVLFLATDLASFAALFASWFYIRFAASTEWPQGGIDKPKLLRPMVMMVILLTSSLTCWWADRGMQKGDRTRLVVGMLATIGLGIAFLAAQYDEYAEDLSKFGPTTNAYGSLFFSITTYHGFHVLIGLLLLGFLVAAGLAGRLTVSQHVRVRTIALFWHVVDGLWVIIVFCLYVSSHL